MYKVLITLGLSDCQGNTIENIHKELDFLKRDISLTFGGYTAYDAQGGYTNHLGDLIEEKSHRIEVILTHNYELPKRKAFVGWFLNRTNQESALIEYKDIIEFFENEQKI
jgi:hypothetical protein